MMKRLQLLVVICVLCCSCIATKRKIREEVLRYKEEIPKFLEVSTKDVHVGLGPEIKPFKQANEIPELIDCTSEDKQQWDNLVGQIKDLAQIFLGYHRTIRLHSKVKNFKREMSEFSKKRKMLYLNKTVELGKKNPKAKEIKDKLDTLFNEIDAVVKESKVSISPLEKELSDLRSEAYRKEFGSADAWRDMKAKEIGVFEVKIEKTNEKYKSLIEKLNSLKKQERLAKRNLMPILERLNTYRVALRNIENEMKNSMDFPESLENLNKEIEKLDTKIQGLMRKHQKFVSDMEDKGKFIRDEINILIEELFLLFKKMVK